MHLQAALVFFYVLFFAFAFYFLLFWCFAKNFSAKHWVLCWSMFVFLLLIFTFDVPLY